MSVTRWDPFRELYHLQRAVNRIFDESAVHGREIAAESGDFFVPADIYENEDAYTIKLEVPGIKPEDIDISVTGQDVVVRGERKTEEVRKGEQWLRAERRYGHFYRAFQVGAPIDAAKVQAAYRHGVLEVTVPKAEETKPRQIQIKVE